MDPFDRVSRSIQLSDIAKTLNADLVIDTAGRASKTPGWLRDLGYETPPESSIEPNLRYASRLYRPQNEHDWQVMILYPKFPSSKKLGVIFGVEDGQWLVTLVGYLGDHPPDDEQGFLQFAKELAAPQIYQLLQEAEPLTDIKTFNYKRQTRRHYERLKRFPSGLIVMADAACSFDPVFGQGMSVAAQQAVELERLLSAAPSDWAVFPKTFQKRIAHVTTVPWMLATGEVRRFPEVTPRRSLWLKFQHWYNGKIYAASGSDAEVYACFLKVLHLTTGPQYLFHPKIVWRVIRQAWVDRFASKQAVATQSDDVAAQSVDVAARSVDVAARSVEAVSHEAPDHHVAS